MITKLYYLHFFLAKNTQFVLYQNLLFHLLIHYYQDFHLHLVINNVQQINMNHANKIVLKRHEKNKDKEFFFVPRSSSGNLTNFLFS